MEQRGGAFGEIGHLGGPVVHFRVNVEGIFAAPVGKEVLAPSALEVAGLAAFPAAGNRDIAAELEELGLQVRIRLSLLEGRNAHIGGLGILRAVSHGEVHPAHEAGEVLQVRGFELFEVLTLHIGQNLLAAGRWISADVLVIHKVRGYGEHERYGVGAANHQAGIRGLQLSLLRKGHHIRLEAHSVAFHLGNEVEDAGGEIAPGAVHGETVPLGGNLPPEGALKPGFHIHAAGFIGRYLHYHHMVRIGHEHLAGHLYAVLGIVHRHYARFHVQFPVVVLNFFSFLEIQQQVSHRHIGLLVGGFSVEMFIHQFLRLLVLFLIHELLDLVIVVVGLRIVVVVGPTGPESGFVERNPLIFNPSKHIAAHVTVADEKAVQPHFAGGFIVPQDHLPAGGSGGLGTGN